jgi:PAS domain S-box-containing protein
MALALAASAIGVAAALVLVSVAPTWAPLIRNGVSGLFLTAAALAIVSVWSAIRERDALIDAVRRQADLNRRLSDSSRSAVFAVDQNMRVTIWNPTLARLTGRAENSVLGRRLAEDGPFLGEAASRNGLSSALRGVEMMCQKIPLQSVNGGPHRWFDAYYTPILDAVGKPRGAVGVIHISSASEEIEARMEVRRPR